MFLAFTVLSTTLLATALYSWGERWRGNFESLVESLFLQPVVTLTLEQFKAFHTWAFWEALRRTDFILDQRYYHSTQFYHSITFLILSSSASLIYQLCYLCYTGKLYSTWDQNICDILAYWADGGWRKALPPHFSVNQGSLSADLLLPPFDQSSSSSLELFSSEDQSIVSNNSKHSTDDPLKARKPRDWYDVLTFTFNVVGLSGILAFQLWLETKK